VYRLRANVCAIDVGEGQGRSFLSIGAGLPIEAGVLAHENEGELVKTNHLVGKARFFNRSSRSLSELVIAMLIVCGLASSSVQAQSYCDYGEYSLVYKTVYVREPVTRYRLVVETVYEERDVTVQRPKWTTETRTREVVTRVPVTETSKQYRKHTVLRPVWETHYRTGKYDRVHYVDETSERIEYRTVLRPVTVEYEKERRYIVRRPVTETVVDHEQVLTYRPKVDYRTQVVDEGQYVNELVRSPGKTSHRLKWLPGGYYCDPTTKQQVWRRAGLHWVPHQASDEVNVQRRYVPNLVEQQIPIESWRAELVTVEKPRTVTRYMDEEVVERVPVKVERMEPVEQVRRVPVTVRRRVVETVSEEVPYRVVRWVRQEIVEEVPTVTRSYKLESHEEKVDVRVCRMVTETKSIQVPHQVRRWVKYETTQLVLRRVIQRIYPDGTVRASNQVTAQRETVRKEPTPADTGDGNKEDEDRNKEGSKEEKEQPTGGETELNAPIASDA